MSEVYSYHTFILPVVWKSDNAGAISGFKQAVKVFSTDAKNDNSKISRTKLLIAIDYVINGKNNDLEKSPEDLKTQENKYLDAAVALKVAMNLFHLK